jgi:hypothetical protein
MSRAFRALELASFVHSGVYLLLLAAAAGLAPLQDAKQALGWTHGCMWIGMSLICLAALRRRILPLRLVVAVVVIGGVGPFVGSYEFVRQARKAGLGRAASQPSER